MYRVSEKCSSGAGSVSETVGGVATDCCSGCGIAADMMKVEANGPMTDSRVVVTCHTA